MSRLARWRCIRPMSTCAECDKPREQHSDALRCNIRYNFIGCGSSGNTAYQLANGGTFYTVEECPDCGGDVEYDDPPGRDPDEWHDEPESRDE